MALTRKFLKALGIEDDKIDEIITAHAESVDGIKAKYTDYEDIRNNLEEITKERDKLKKEVETFDNGEDEIAKLKKQIEEYENKETLSNKRNAVKELIKSAGIDEKRIDSILKLTDLNTVEMVDGAVKDAEKFTENIKTEYADFLVKTETEEHIPSNPPAKSDNPTEITKEKFDKMSYNDRLKLYNENKELYENLKKEG